MSRISPSHALRRAPLLPLFLLALLLCIPAAAQPRQGGTSPAGALAADSVPPAAAPAGRTADAGQRDEADARSDERLPDPFWATLLVILLGGAVGAFASDLVADGGVIARPTHNEQGWMLGWLGKLVVGSVAAVVVLTLNPTSDWWMLFGTAVTAGLGGEAVLLSRVATSQAEEARKDREAAERQLARAGALNAEQLETFRTLAIQAHHQRAPAHPTVNVQPGERATSPGSFEEQVTTYATRARAEFQVAAE